MNKNQENLKNKMFEIVDKYHLQWFEVAQILNCSPASIRNIRIGVRMSEKTIEKYIKRIENFDGKMAHGSTDKFKLLKR